MKCNFDKKQTWRLPRKRRAPVVEQRRAGGEQEWIELSVLIFAALGPYPEARSAVEEALRSGPK